MKSARHSTEPNSLPSPPGDLDVRDRDRTTDLEVAATRVGVTFGAAFADVTLVGAVDDDTAAA
jgi:hypothetical protein